MNARGKTLALAFLTLLAVGWAVAPSIAQDEETGGSAESAGFPEQSEPTSSVDDDLDPTADLTRAAVRLIVALIVVIAFVIGLAFLLKRTSHRLRQTGDDIAVLAQAPLGPSQFLSVVDIAGEILVLGVTEHSITALSEIEDPAIIAKLREDGTYRRRSGAFLQSVPTFKQLLGRAEQGNADSR